MKDQISKLNTELAKKTNENKVLFSEYKKTLQKYNELQNSMNQSSKSTVSEVSSNKNIFKNIKLYSFNDAMTPGKKESKQNVLNEDSQCIKW